MENEEWKMAKDWVISTGIKPMTTKPLENIVDLFDFAQSLRDGVILCQIINRLKPGTIVDFSEVSNIQMHLVSFSYYSSHDRIPSYLNAIKPGLLIWLDGW